MSLRISLFGLLLCLPLIVGCEEDGSVKTQSAPPDVAISNLVDGGIVETGFLVGTTTGDSEAETVEVSLDGEDFEAADGTTEWAFRLPTGSQTWRDGTSHTISVQASNSSGDTSDPVEIEVRKGTNKDINGDGYADAIVGAIGYSSSRGRVYVFHSRGTSGVTTDDSPTTALSEADSVLTGDSPSNSFGGSTTTGDLNSDGFADVLVAATQAGGNQGIVYSFHSRGSTGVAQNAVPVGASAEAESSFVGEASANLFGISLATGDINSDGYGDAIVGAYGYSTSTGRVYVFHSHGGTGLTPSAGLGQAALTGAESVLTGQGINNNFGISVATGDFDGDGYSDVIAGASDSTGPGRAYVFHSRGVAGLTPNSTPVGAATEADSTVNGESSGNSFGYTVCAADLTGDGYADALVGAYTYSSSTGRVYAFHSRGSTGITANATPLGALAEADSVLTGEGANNGFGVDLTKGDVNGDGLDDAIAGAYNFATLTGRVYVFHSRGTTGVTADSTALGVIAEADSVISGETTNTYFGGALATGDMNRDGFTDLMAGAFQYASNTGRAYVFHSRGTAGVTAVASPQGAVAEADTVLDGESAGTAFGVSVGK